MPASNHNTNNYQSLPPHLPNKKQEKKYNSTPSDQQLEMAVKRANLKYEKAVVRDEEFSSVLQSKTGVHLESTLRGLD